MAAVTASAIAIGDIIFLIAEFVIALVPDIMNWVRSISNKGYNAGTVYAIIDKVMTEAKVKSSKQLNDLTKGLQDIITTYYPGGGIQFTDYINKAKRKAEEELDFYNKKGIEQEVYSASADQLASVYEGLSKSQKKSKTGQALLDQIENNTAHAVHAAKEIDPKVDTSKLEAFDYIGERGGSQKIQDVLNVERKV